MASSLALQPDGKVVAGGTTIVRGHVGGAGVEPAEVLLLARFNPDGSLDAGFGNAGTVLTPFARRDAEGRALVRQPSGHLVLAGEVGSRPSSGGPGGRAAFLLARYRADGALDRRFGGDGTVVTRFRHRRSGAAGLALRPRGGLVAAGSSGRSFALAAYRRDGSLDRRFGRGGRVLTSFPGFASSSAAAAARALAGQPNGRIVAGGVANRSCRRYWQCLRFALARYRPDGSLDRRFGQDGRVTTGSRDDGPPILGDGGIHALVAQPGGRVVAAGGLVRQVAGERLTLARYRPDGRLDRGFGTNGRALAGTFDGGEAHALALQPDGKLVAAGHGHHWFSTNGLVARFLGG